MHRFFIPPESINNERVVFPHSVADQMRNVLRVAPGEQVVVLTGDGWECVVEITYIGKGNAAGKPVERRQNDREPRVALTLYQCLLKKDHFEWVLQKCTEVGVARIVPVLSQRTVVRSDETSAGKRERWTRIVTEAAEQSGRGLIPALGDVLTFEEALADCAAHDFSAIAWEEERGATLERLAAGVSPASVGLIVGPEGGFGAEEAELARSQGIRPVTLGARTLRAETAAVVFVALAMHRFGELG